MLLDEEDVQEFKRLYAEEFSEEITDKDARIMASQLLRLYEVLSKPLPSENPSGLAKNEVKPVIIEERGKDGAQ